MPSPKRSTVSTRPRSFIGADHGGTSKRWNSPLWNESTGSTTDDFWSPSETYRLPKPKNVTTPCWTKQPWPHNSNQMASGKPGAVQVIGQPQLNKRLKESVPNALFGPAAEAHIDRIPLAVSLMHVAAWAADPQDMQHAAKELPIVVGWPRLASPFRRKKTIVHVPFLIGQIATDDYRSSQRASCESESSSFGNR